VYGQGQAESHDGAVLRVTLDTIKIHVAILAGLLTILWALFQRPAEAMAAEKREALGRYVATAMSQIRLSDRVQALPDIFASYFDSLLGRHPLSWKRLVFGTTLALVSTIVAGFVGNLIQGIEPISPMPEDTNWWMLTHIATGSILWVLMFPITGFLANHAALEISRRLVERVRSHTSPWTVAFMLLVDPVLNIAAFSIATACSYNFIAALLSPNHACWLAFRTPHHAWRLLEGSFHSIWLVLSGRTGNTSDGNIIIAGLTAPLLATMITSLWLWLIALGLATLPLARVADRALSWLSPSEHPLQTIGVMATYITLFAYALFFVIHTVWYTA
jgi:hypothetical protein